MTQKQSKEERVGQILEAAIEEFLEKGYDGASVESIAKRAGLTKGGVYHHFTSKDEILFAANSMFQQPVSAMIEHAYGLPSATEGLRFFIREYLRFWERHPKAIAFVFLSMSKMLSVPSIWHSLATYFSDMSRFMESLLERGVALGELRTHSTHCRAIAIIASLDGSTAYMIVSETLSATELAAQLIETLVDDLAIPDVSGKRGT